MGVSSRCAVAVHALTLLARWSDERLMPSAEIADSLESNPVVVRRILGMLRNSSLVLSTEGSGGGWRLARPAREITLLDAYVAVEEGPIFSLHPHPPSSECIVARNVQALLEAEFQMAEQTMAERLGETTIAGMLRRVLARDTERATQQV